jgi:hypothetical protein
MADLNQIAIWITKVDGLNAPCEPMRNLIIFDFHGMAPLLIGVGGVINCGSGFKR